ncbi:MAG: hypothetical protein HXX08_00820 [Chloroflexi bacterium]|uniref:Helix-turn-helix domain-containing protein n=1 Tax=Candidatus Chlorohelix allophototropha TaxID=3003348 RepID=A0A8T7LQY7_9CHLR|nr:hypothetical protein [Chloroflexota bacterium]WJW66290.1 hypothetical protein OZ401_002083 [Chloroflexota bacterium L227-S17]
MSNDSKIIRPAFMDAVEAAANLKTDRQTVLQYIQEGKLKSFGGKSGNPFVRTADVDALAAVLGILPTKEEEPPDPRTVQKNDPVRKIKLRIQQDAKWNELSESDMRLWAKEIDPVTFVSMRKVATEAISKLESLIKIIDETSKSK